jgi:hypothetical protein
MASNYGRNFGFRRSDETMRTSEGRLRTPAAGTFRIGQLVSYDEANAGFLKAATSGEVGDGATVGLLIQEEQFIGSIYGQGVPFYDSNNLGVAKNNTLSVITSGAGTKVWFKNTAAETRADGRALAGVTMVDLTGAALKGFLTWDGTKFVGGGTAANSMLQITALDVANGYVEAVLTR